MSSLRTLCACCTLAIGLSGCDLVGDQINKQKLVGKAIGAGCRQTGRSLEDCYNRNPKVSKPDIFTGWKEMNEYMQAKKLDIIPPPPDQHSAQAGDDGGESPVEMEAASATSTASAAQPAKQNAAKR